MFILYKRCSISSIRKVLHLRILLVICDISPLPKHHQLTKPHPPLKLHLKVSEAKTILIDLILDQTVLSWYMHVFAVLFQQIYILLFMNQKWGGGVFLNGTAISGNRAEKCRKRAETCRKGAETCRKGAKAHRGVL